MRFPMPVRATLLGLIFAGTAAGAATLKQPFEKSYPLKAGGAFAIHNVNGGVDVEAWDRDEVRVVAEKKVRAGSEATAKKILDQVRIEATPSAGSLRIDTKLPRRHEGLFDWLSGNHVEISVAYHVQVPKSVRVDAESVNGHVALTGTRGDARLETTNGHITVSRTAGRLELESTNGGIDVADAAGAVKAATTNGHIDVRLVQLPAGAELSLDTTNGGVSVTLPRQARFSLDAATTNGSVHSDFAVAAGHSTRRRVEGDVNGGGGRLLARTTNGGIRISEL
jgi:putative adhesin